VAGVAAATDVGVNVNVGTAPVKVVEKKTVVVKEKETVVVKQKKDQGKHKGHYKNKHENGKK
jgi:hypothetical protein